MNITESDIIYLIELLKERVAKDKSLQYHLEKLLGEIMEIPPLYDDVIDREKDF